VTTFHRGYDIECRESGGKVRALIHAKNGLPPIHNWPLENSTAEAEKAAKALIDAKLASERDPDSN
jgi:hypothetical protein